MPGAFGTVVNHMPDQSEAQHAESFCLTGLGNIHAKFIQSEPRRHPNSKTFVPYLLSTAETLSHPV